MRHDTTTLNRHRGRDVPLDAQGYQDAIESAERLAHVGLPAVHAGLLRCIITAAQIITAEARSRPS